MIEFQASRVLRIACDRAVTILFEDGGQFCIETDFQIRRDGIATAIEIGRLQPNASQITRPIKNNARKLQRN